MGSGGRRPGAGRKRDDPAAKRLRGTERNDRDGEAPAPMVPGAMVAPSYLSSDLGQLLFGSIAQILEQQGRAARGRRREVWLPLGLGASPVPHAHAA